MDERIFLMYRKSVSWLSVALVIAGLWGCGESQKTESSPPLPLAMDLPKTDPDMKKSKGEIADKTVPETGTVNLDLTLSEEHIEKALKESPITNKSTCLAKIDQLDKKRNAIQREGGMWGLLEQSIDLREYSPIGMQLDHNLNTMAYALRHLCETANGRPFDDLARFLINNLESQGEEKTRKLLIQMGKAPAVIDNYMDYAQFAKKANQRKIPYPSIHRSLLWGELFITTYDKFARRLMKKESLDNAVPQIKGLNTAVLKFIEEEPNVKTAVLEDVRMPLNKGREM